jgi:hypothetical protein
MAKDTQVAMEWLRMVLAGDRSITGVAKDLGLQNGQVAGPICTALAQAAMDLKAEGKRIVMKVEDIPHE